MKKSQLLELLSSVPGDPEICIVDTQKNDLASPNTIASLERGVYPKFNFHLKDLLSDESAPKWIALEFEPTQLQPVTIKINNKTAGVLDLSGGFINATHKSSNSDECCKTGLKCIHACTGQCKESC